MAISWHEVEARYQELNLLLSNPDLEQKKREAFQKERSRIEEALTAYRSVESLVHEKEQLQEQIQAAVDPELKELFQLELEEISRKAQKAEQELEDLLYPSDELENASVFLEIRAGTGGQEAALFAADLLKMYTLYAQSKGWTVSLADMSTTDLGGIREATLHIEGKKVYKHLKYEGGVHRVQRVPKTETQGRVHTSTATVAVLPEAEEVDVSINPSDLRIDTYRASGAGGQHVNKTDSAIRITHVPTGIVVACQEDRSQHKNRAKAMKMLQARMVAAQREKQEAEESKKRKEMVGTGMRAEKVRTYNFPQNRVTDHQVEVTLKKLDMVMEGDLDDIIEPLIAKGREDRKKKAFLCS
jgi:peptide chain release factor 1